MLKCRDSVG